MTTYLDPDVLSRITPLGFRARSVMEESVSGGHRSPLQGVSPEFADHREYVPGDDLKNLDWRVFARSDRFYIKRFEEESNLRCTFVVDASGSMSYGRGKGAEGRRGKGGSMVRGRGVKGQRGERDAAEQSGSALYPSAPAPFAPSAGSSKFHLAATAAACLASVLMRQRDAVGLATFDNALRDVLPPRANTRHFTQVLDTLAATDPVHAPRPRGETEVGTVLSEVADRAGRGGMVVVLSDLLCDLERLGEGLSRLRHGRHEVIVMQVLHGDEIDLPFNQSTMFRDIESAASSPEEVYGEPWAFRQAYQKEMQRFIADAHARCRQRGIDHVLLQTDRDLGVTLSRWLHERGRG